MEFFFTSHQIVVFGGLFLVAVAGLLAVVRWAYRKAADENAPEPAFRLMIVISVTVFFLVTVCGYFVTDRMVKSRQQLMREETNLTITVLRIALESSIGKFNAAAASLAGSPWIRPALLSRSAADLGHADSVIDRYCKAFGAATVYVLDTSGQTIASSNRRAPDSFVGKNYAFRPYFGAAMRGEHYGYFAVGVTSGKRGYYRSAPVVDSSGKIIGAVVVKNGLETLDSIFASVHTAYLVDRNGVVFLSSDTLSRPRPLCALGENRLDDAALHAQYGDFDPRPLLPGCLGSNAETVMRGKSYYYAKVPIEVPGWQVVQMSSESSARWYRLFGYLVTTVLILLTFIVISHIALARIRIWAELISLSEKQFRTMFENAPEPIIISAVATGEIIAANPLARKRLVVLSKSSGIGDLFVGDDTGRITLPLESGSVQGMFHQKGTGEHQRHFSVSSAQLPFRGKACVVSFLRDVTEFIEAQEALETSELRYREITEFLPEGVFEVNETGFFTYANKRALQMFGYRAEEFANGIRPVDVIVPEDRERVMKNMKDLIQENIPSHHEYTGLCKDGHRFPVLVHSTIMFRDKQPVGFRGVVMDLTERKKIELELQKKDKLDALGILAGGIAHDFNNILTVIWSGFSVVKLQRSAPDETSGLFGEMESALRRGRDLTGQLLTYAKGGAPIKTAASLAEIVEETAAFATSGSNVRYVIDADAALRAAEVDPTQISQVVQNLIINAIDAMPQGGNISIALRNIDGTCCNTPDSMPEKYVEIRISDTGSGIPESIQARIYDPFFSTKPNGSGLGLATAYSIVKNHGGTISFDSTVGKGTTFRVVLPASEKNPVKPPAIDAVVRKGAGHVLVMDDEPTILVVTAKLLTMLGYTVEKAISGEEAVTAAKNALDEGQRFEVIILDLTVPGGMGGKDAVKKLHAIDPQVKCIVSSGYSNDPIMANFREYGFDAVIAKPYDIQKLGGVIRSLLDVAAAA